MALAFASESDDDEGPREGLGSLLRLFQRESHQLQDWDATCQPSAFAQHVSFRARTLRFTTLAADAEERLVAHASPWFVLLWRTHRESPNLVRVLSGHQGVVNSVALSPDGRRLATGSDDRTVALWDVQSGKRLATLAVDGAIGSVAWHPHGDFLIVGDAGGNLYYLEYREPSPRD